MTIKAFRPFDSITFRIVIVILIMFLPISAVVGIINLSYIQTGVQQIATSRETLLDNYVSQIDRELELAEKEMNQLAFTDTDILNLTDRSSSDFYYASNNLHQEMQNRALYYQYISGFFVYAPASDFSYCFLRDSSLADSEDTIQRYIADVFPDKIRNSFGWQSLSIGEDTYLLQGYYHNGVFVGAFLSLSHLQADTSQGTYILAEDISSISLSYREQLIHASSERCALCLYEVIDTWKTMSALPFLQRYLIFITLMVIACVPVLLLRFRSMIIQPIHRLTDAIHQMMEGDLDHQIEILPKEASEFREADQAFNHMVSQIHDLKIAIYEEKLEIEHTRLQNLSYQLRPHFMINCLNMAYNMILSRDYTTASRLMRFSAGYMRYLLKTEEDFVPLQEELAHLQDYMNIQLVRYEGQFSYECTVDPFVEDIMIPSMILQNFLENSVKYSITPESFTTISLKIQYEEKDGIPCALVIIHDNGKGYPEWLLKALAEEDMEALHDRIGLRNTMQRIRMLYGERAEYRFYNQDGAVSRFLFPIDMEEDDE